MNILPFYALASAMFIASTIASPYPADFLVKIIPIALLFWMVHQSRGDWRRRIVMLALFCSAAGDIAMERNAFIYGLSAFLLAQLSYLIVLISSGPIRPAGIPLAIGAVLISVAISWFLLPHTGEMRVPVLVYGSVITAMAVAAILCGGNQWLVAVGAVIFTVSDALIAANRFVAEIPAATFLIMLTYYTAQYLLTTDARSNNYAAEKV